MFIEWVPQKATMCCFSIENVVSFSVTSHIVYSYNYRSTNAPGSTLDNKIPLCVCFHSRAASDPTKENYADRKDLSFALDWHKVCFHLAMWIAESRKGCLSAQPKVCRASILLYLSASISCFPTMPVESQAHPWGESSPGWSSSASHGLVRGLHSVLHSLAKQNHLLFSLTVKLGQNTFVVDEKNRNWCVFYCSPPLFFSSFDLHSVLATCRFKCLTEQESILGCFERCFILYYYTCKICYFGFLYWILVVSLSPSAHSINYPQE